MRIGFIGSSYEGQSVKTASERTVNWVPEVIENGKGIGDLALMPSPGRRSLTTFPGDSGRGVFAQDGRLFVVISTKLYEVFSDWTFDEKGTVAEDPYPAIIKSNGVLGNQLFILSAGLGYILDLVSDVFTALGGGAFDAAFMAAFLDGRFIVALVDSATFQLSELNNGLLFTGGAGQRSSSSDLLNGMVARHPDLWLFGSQQTEVWYNSGGTFPFSPHREAAIQQGSAARFAPSVQGAVFWLSQNENGSRMAHKAEGYTPQRISTHPMEEAWKAYSQADFADVEGFCYQEGGHQYWVLNFPDITWVYDDSTKLWHERGFWNIETGAYEQDKVRCHAFAFGKHLSLARDTADLYEMSTSIYDDDGSMIRRLRQGPTVHGDGKQVFAREFEVELDAGVGLTSGQGSDPAIAFSYSKNGGKTWGNERVKSAGKKGRFADRVSWTRLGATRAGFVPRIVVTDPVPWRILEGYLTADIGAN